MLQPYEVIGLIKDLHRCNIIFSLLCPILWFKYTLFNERYGDIIFLLIEYTHYVHRLKPKT